MFHYWSNGTDQDHVFSFQLTWLMSESVQGAADPNELLRTCKDIRAGNREDWYAAFSKLGEQLEDIASQADTKGFEATASDHFYRAFTAFRSAERVLAGTDPRKLASYRRAMRCWRRGMALSVHPHEHVEVLLDGHRLDGWFFAPRHRIKREPAPCIVFLSGADALPEENFFRGVQYVTARGAACFVFNGPGQGSALREHGLVTRFDYEKPVSAAVDALMQRSDFDHSRLGLLGVSMAGYYAPRAAAYDERFKALCAWGGLHNVGSDLYDYYPPIREQLRWIGGCADDEEARRKYAAFDLDGVAENIRCPVLITHGELDRMVPLSSARRTFDALTVADKELRIYSQQEGGAEHCSMDNWGQVVPYQVDWLIEKLSR